MPATSFHKLKAFLSDFCDEILIRQCSNLSNVVDFLLENFKLHLFNIDTLIVCCKFFNVTINISVQQYKQILNTFLSSTTVKEFKDILQTKVLDCTDLESITLILNERFGDEILKALKQLVHHFFGTSLRYFVTFKTGIQKSASKKQQMKSHVDVIERGKKDG